MKKPNLIKDKSFAFALDTIDLYRYLAKDKREFVISKQLVRSGTSIGANIEEALGAQSKKDFISKLYIAYKEARETNYWLLLLRESHYLEESNNIFISIGEIKRILSKIILTSKKSVHL